MSKITVSRLFEISKFLTTNSGKELQGALQYLSELAETTIRTLRKGITFADNVDCELRTVSITTGTASPISAPVGKRVTGVLLQKVGDSTYYIVDKFGWGYNSSGLIVIFCSLVNSSGSAPSAATPVDVDLLLLFG